MANGPTVLCILDGWGYREDSTDNAIKLANTPVYDRLWDSAPRAWLATSGAAVGLPDGQMGNSEIGHMNIGAGRVVLADLPQIDAAIADGSLAQNERLLAFITTLQTSGGRAHLLGLLSPGGVHSHQDHMVALARILDQAGIACCIHAILDGRDTPPESARGYMQTFEDNLKAQAPKATIATVSGRYYAMDRDKRWDRVEKAYRIISAASGPRFETADAAIAASYGEDISDEFLVPAAIGDYSGMAAGDGLLMANFRADRAREILATFVDPAFGEFETAHPKLSATLGMVEYSEALSAYMPATFPPETIADSFGEVVARAGLKQLRIAETEKYAHVTFFLSGGREAPFDGEDRILVPSPDVATYDLKPEMSAPEVTDKLVAAIEGGAYAAIVVNYANPDMVGHTGDLQAAIKAIEAVDAALGKIEAAVLRSGGALMITADHGNAELMRDQQTGDPHTAHTHFDVPVLLVGRDTALADGKLADVAPTLLELMGLPIPGAMTGKSLLNGAVQRRA